MHDVIVVGAGPSGGFAAFKCASMGLRTLLLDKCKLPREKACGGVAGREIIKHCGKEILEVVEVESRGTELYYDFEPMETLDREKLFFKREKLDYFITQLARGEGCEVRDGTEVIGISVKENGARLNIGMEELESEIVIAADGAYSLLRKKVGFDIKTRRHYAALRSEVSWKDIESKELLKPNEDGYQHTHFFSDLLGFAWLIPNRDDLNIGMGTLFEKSSDLKRRFREFLGHFGLSKQMPSKGHLIPYKPLDKVYSDRVLFVGDAGGFVDPWTGCGIDSGVVSARIAADACRMAFDDDDFTSSSLCRYQKMLAPMLRRLRFRSSAISMLDNLTPRRFALTTLGEVFIKHMSKLA